MNKINLSSPLQIFLVSFMAMVVALATLGYAAYQVCYELLAKDLGLRAQATAQVAAHLVNVDNRLFDELLKLNITESRNHPVSLEFKRRVAPIIEDTNVKYIYIEKKLKGDQIRYFVKPEEEEIYGQPAGTPLEYFYVFTSENEVNYTDQDRFDTVGPLREKVYVDKRPMYGLPVDTKWGNLLTGCAPLFDANNHFVGVVGVDISGNEFLSSAYQVRNIIVVSFGIIVLLGGVILYRASQFLSKPMYIDELTKLFNRQYMKARLEEEIYRARRYNRPLSILMIDLDFFKRINDSFGHQSGDLVLQRVSEVILANLRLEDIACRYGGEEMAVILPETDLQEATVVAERLRMGIETTHFSSCCNQPIKVTISIGVAEITVKDTQTDLLHRADKALYLAKSRGRNCYMCCG